MFAASSSSSDSHVAHDAPSSGSAFRSEDMAVCLSASHQVMIGMTVATKNQDREVKADEQDGLKRKEGGSIRGVGFVKPGPSGCFIPLPKASNGLDA
jgi:hypothetical protein